MELKALVGAIAAQEAMLIFDHFDEAAAWKIGVALRDEAAMKSWPIVVDIRLFHRPLFFAALPGSTPDNIEWARRKRNVVERYHKSTYRIGRELALIGEDITSRYGLSRADYADHGGGFPITVRGVGVIGAVIVSGLAQEDDHMAIVNALGHFLGRDTRSLQFAK